MQWLNDAIELMHSLVWDVVGIETRVLEADTPYSDDKPPEERLASARCPRKTCSRRRRTR